MVSDNPCLLPSPLIALWRSVWYGHRRSFIKDRKMKTFLTIATIFFFVPNLFAQREIKVEEAKDHVGDSVKICTKIFGAIVNDNAAGDGIYLFAGGNYPNAPLTLLIRNENRRFFDYVPEKDLKDRGVCITGRIELVKDKPQIFISKQGQIDIQ